MNANNLNLDASCHFGKFLEKDPFIPPVEQEPIKGGSGEKADGTLLFSS